jgi:hypothetical protein
MHDAIAMKAEFSYDGIKSQQNSKVLIHRVIPAPLIVKKPSLVLIQTP